jgi:nucleotide-binding universal stress UspA family protein
MLSIPKILLPVDFSEVSEDAANLAIAFTRRFGSELTMLHACPDTTVMTPESGLWLADTLKESKKMLDEFMRDETCALNVHRLVERGDAANVIVNCASRAGAHLIVLGTRGHGAFRRFLIGSVSAKVLHDADCPILTLAHAPETPARAIRRILCAIDFGPNAEKTVRWGCQLASALKARLGLLHVLPFSQIAAGAETYDTRKQWEGRVRRQCERLLADVGTDAEVFIEAGDVADAVRMVAQADETGLVVVGRHSPKGKLHRLKQHAYAIIRESPCPVLSV